MMVCLMFSYVLYIYTAHKSKCNYLANVMHFLAAIYVYVTVYVFYSPFCYRIHYKLLLARSITTL